MKVVRGGAIDRVLSSLSQMILYFLVSGIQIATVQGGISQCGSIDFPGIFVRLDNSQVHQFIFSVMENKNEGKIRQRIGGTVD